MESNSNRNSVPGDVVRLLARGGLGLPTAGRLKLLDVDKALEAAGMTGVRAMEAKMKLAAAGVLSPT